MESLTISQVNGLKKIVVSFPNLDLNDPVQVTIKGRNGVVLNGAVLTGAVHDHRDAHTGLQPPSYYTIFPLRFGSSSGPPNNNPARSGGASSFWSFLPTLSEIAADLVESFWDFLLGRSCSRPFALPDLIVPRAEIINGDSPADHIHYLIHCLSAVFPFAAFFAAENLLRAFLMLLSKNILDYVFLIQQGLWQISGGSQLLGKLATFPVVGWFIRPVLWFRGSRGGKPIWQFFVYASYIRLFNGLANVWLQFFEQ